MRRAGAAVLAILLANPGAAQDAAPVRSSVESVAAEVEVLVLDGKGTPVDGLTKSDFKLFVNGKETALEWFEAPPAAPAVAPQGQAATPGESVPVRREHSTVFVISDLNTDVRARNAGLAAFRAYANQMPDGEPAAVYLLDNGVRTLQVFTSDRAAVLKALERPAKTLPRAYVFAEQGSVEWVGQSRQMFRNLATVLDIVANRPEPKTIVVLSGPVTVTGFIAPIGGPAGSGAMGRTTIRTGAGRGSPVPQFDVLSASGNAYSARGLWNFLLDAKAAESQALLARATIVALDPTGLDSANARADINTLALVPHDRHDASLRPADSSAESDLTDTWAFRNDAFSVITTATGGARLGYSNAPDDSLVRESHLLARRYRLGFSPPDGTSARRDIRVDVLRPGLAVRAANGQRSLTAEAAARSRFAALLLSDNAPTSDFIIAVEMKSSIRKRTDDALPFDVLVPVSGVYAEDRGENRRAKLELLVAAVDYEGRASEPMVIPFSAELTKATAVDGAFFRTGSTFTIDKKWKGRLFVGVRDTATNRIGAIAMPIGG